MPAPVAGVQCIAIATFADGTTLNVSSLAVWASSDTSLATVSSTGLVTAVGNGLVTIRATYEGVTGSIQLRMTAPGQPTAGRQMRNNIPRGRRHPGSIPGNRWAFGESMLPPKPL